MPCRDTRPPARLAAPAGARLRRRSSSSASASRWLPIGLGYLNGLTPAEATPDAAARARQAGDLRQHCLSFDTKTLVVPANRPFELVFNNNDPGVPHNVQFDDSSARNQILFDGEVVTGVDNDHLPGSGARAGRRITSSARSIRT